MSSEVPQVMAYLEELIQHHIQWKGSDFTEGDRKKWEEERIEIRNKLQGDLEALIDQRSNKVG